MAKAYWQPIDFFHWSDHAAAGNFLEGQGVYIDGVAANQINDVVIVDVLNTGVRCGLRLKGGRYVRPGAGVYSIGRFAEIGQFINGFGGRFDLPVFEQVYP